MRGRDEKFLADSADPNSARRFAELLRRVLVGIEPEQLTTGDRNHIMLWLIMNCYAPAGTFNIRCGECASINMETVEYVDLGTHILADDATASHSIQLGDGTELPVRMMRVADEIMLGDLPNTGELDRLACAIGNGQSHADRVKMLEGMTLPDIQKIRKWLTLVEHGPDTRFSYRCSTCDAESVAHLPITLALFFPAGHAARGPA
jgi:hypothetical protein